MILEKIVKAADELNTENWPENFEERDKAQVLVLEISKKEDLKATPEEIEAEVMKIMMHLNSSNPNEKVDEVRVKAYAEQIIVNEKVLAMLEK
jgi:FKBP-type peptidyl-prolyl cis-trans isomerase (trigger factor)